MTEDALKIIGTSTLFLGILTFLIRQLIKNLLSKEIEHYKGEISKTLYEHQVRFKALYDKRLDIIESLYNNIKHIRSCLEQYVKVYVGHFEYVDENVDEEIFRIRNTLKEKTAELETFIDLNRLYLPTTTIHLADRFLIQSWHEHDKLVEDHLQRNEGTLVDYIERLKNNIDTVLIEIEKEFKKLIGAD